MSTDTRMFRGWPAEALEFYERLEADNSKTYWTAHKETVVLSPMKAIPADLTIPCPRQGLGPPHHPVSGQV
jgi:hypothetical protein